jgi:uncharacterized Zn finger protein
MTSDPSIKQVYAPCSGCLRKTNHNILHETALREEDRIRTYAMLQCYGCGNVCLAEQILFTEDGEKEFTFLSSNDFQKKTELARFAHYGQKECLYWCASQ